MRGPKPGGYAPAPIEDKVWAAAYGAYFAIRARELTQSGFKLEEFIGRLTEDATEVADYASRSLLE
jgi:hypothetical protein